jgi:uncharacterized repeat protein (TIGR02543 family)
MTSAGQPIADCTICPVGDFCIGGTSYLTQCTRGSYQDQTGQSACITCPDGTTTTSIGSAYSSMCYSCYNAAGATGWMTQSWLSDNTMQNWCEPTGCNIGYTLQPYTGYSPTGHACIGNTYIATLDANGGTLGDVTSLTMNYGSTPPSIPQSSLPTRSAEYVFDGFYGTPTAGLPYIIYNGSGAFAWDILGDATIYAHWRCLEGYYKSDESCLICPMGHACPYNGTYTENHTCTEGSYQSSTGQTTCIACPSGTTTTSTGSTSSSNCSACLNSQGVATWATQEWIYRFYFDPYYYANVMQNWCEPASCSTGYTIGAYSGYNRVYSSNGHACFGNNYTVTLNANGGTLGSTTSLTATYGSPLPTVTGLPTRAGCAFSGFYIATNGGTQYISSTGSSVRDWDILSANTLYANWTTTVALDANGGTLGSTTSITAALGAVLPIIASDALPTRVGYTFNGFWSATSGGTQYVNVNGTPTAATWTTAGGTIYAHWTANTYTVTYDSNGGSTPTMTTSAVIYGGYLPYWSSGDLPTRIGYTFAGWFSAPSGGIKYNNADGTNTAATWTTIGDGTAYAQWTPRTYTVTLNANGGTLGSTTSVTATYGSVLPTITGLPTRTGYTLTGFFSAITGGTQYANASGVGTTEWNIASSTTLYAQWTCAQGYYLNGTTCTICPAGSVCPGGALTGYAPCAIGSYTTSTSAGNYSCVACPAGTTTPTTGGTSLSNCNTTCPNASYTTGWDTPAWAYNDANDCWSTTCITGYEVINHICYAKTYIISLNANGGTLGSTTYVAASWGANLPGISELPTHPGGYAFNGFWSVTVGGTRYVQSNGAPDHVWDQDVANPVIYAQWVGENKFYINGQKPGKMYNNGFEIIQAYINGEQVL